jgi:hypothetical protein
MWRHQNIVCVTFIDEYLHMCENMFNILNSIQIVSPSMAVIPLDPVDALPSTCKSQRQHVISGTTPTNVDDLLGGRSAADDDGGETMQFTDDQREESLLDFSGDPIMNPVVVVEDNPFRGDDGLDDWFLEKRTDETETKQQRRIEEEEAFETDIPDAMDEFALSSPEGDILGAGSSTSVDQMEPSSSIDWFASSGGMSGRDKETIQKTASTTVPALGMTQVVDDFDESIFLDKLEDNPPPPDDVKGSSDLADTLFSSGKEEEYTVEAFETHKGESSADGEHDFSWMFSSGEASGGGGGRETSAGELPTLGKTVDEQREVDKQREVFSFDEFSSSSEHLPHSTGTLAPKSKEDGELHLDVGHSGKESEGHGASDSFGSIPFDVANSKESHGEDDLLGPDPVDSGPLVPTTAEGTDLIDFMECRAEDEKKPEDWDSFF